MELVTSRFGTIEYGEGSVIEFPEGIIGFFDKKRFLILDHKPGSPFRWLQSVDDGELAFLIIEPSAFRPDYDPLFSKADCDALGCPGREGLKTYAIVVVPEDPKRMYANLLGPVAVNPGERLGRQVILSNGRYTTCHYIIDELRNSYGAPYACAVKETE